MICVRSSYVYGPHLSDAVSLETLVLVSVLSAGVGVSYESRSRLWNVDLMKTRPLMAIIL